ncbi:MAG: cellulase family glycosylhydrolase [Ruminococcus sp.]|nr:cellulase family glycosylhydrolase [Ruminococcus sp.]
MLKLLKRTCAAAAAGALLATGAASAVSAAPASAAPDAYHDDWLHVNENAEIVDMYGNPVWITGCNWFGYNVGSQVFDGVWSINMHQALNEIADHGFNFLRVPMSTQILLQWKNNEPDPIIKINEWKNPELTVEGIEGGTPKYSFDIWNQAVEWCRENGIKIMMDVHCATTNAAGHNYALWYDSNYSEEDWLDALAWFADYYKDDDTILAIDLKNEPHGKKDEGIFAKWDGSSDANNWRYSAEKGAQACLEKNPNLLIMVEGIEVYPKFEKGFDWESDSTDYSHYGDPEYQPYHGAWWGGNFRGARDYPVDLGKYQSQLVYSPHDYGPLVYEQTWFRDIDDPTETFTKDTLMEDYWYDTWAFLAEEKISPLLMGEWGGFIDAEHDPTGENKHWMEVLRDYMIEKRIHHTFWCFNENSSDTGGLIAGECNWEHWDEEKYEFVKPSLWQDENGRFISLDHTIPVGTNGITLTEYYSGVKPTDPQPTTVKPTDPEPSTAPLTDPQTTSGSKELWGDANLDGKIDLSDTVAILQFAALPAKYPLTEQGEINADVVDNGTSGVNGVDALAIQMVDAKIITAGELPISKTELDTRK